MKDSYIKILAFVVTLFILTALMPRKNVLRIDFSLGEVWQGDEMTALFDFPILKSSAEYNADLEEVTKHYIPIYSKSEVIYRNLLELFAHDFDINKETSDTLSTDQKEQIKLKEELYNSLSKIYQRGVVNSLSSSQQDSSEIELIRIISGNEITTTALSNLYTIKSAKDAVMPLVSQINSIENSSIDRYLGADILYDQQLNLLEKQKLEAMVSHSRGFIPEGSLLIKSGQVVDGDLYDVLSSYKAEHQHRVEGHESFNVLLGNFLYVLIVLSLSYCFLVNFRSQFTKKLGNTYFLLFIYIFMTLLCFLVSKVDFLNYYLIPMAIVPFYIVTFYDIRMSVFEYSSVLMICSMFTPSPLEYFFINLFAGLAGIFALRNTYHRRRFFHSMGLVLLVYIVGFVSFALINNPDIKQINWLEIIWFFGNILLLIALYQLIYIFEKVFNFVTNITLFELCDTNHSLLKELAEKAPGTFQHSMQVANLSEAAAKAIGANHMYARAGALYHDIGKMNNPLYFIENTGTNYNPHQMLTPFESAQIIKQHVTDGVALAKKYKLPNLIAQFIPTHHAKALIYFFYHQHKELNPDEEVDIEKFSYSGPLPSTKEATICMMADSIEAASRTLKDYSPKSISDLVDKVVATQLQEGNFVESQLTYADLEVVKGVFKTKLMGIYHQRVEYPDR